ncbi:uncharacterized protein LOC124439724 [Xenia sp. Carnegie-2017]|uniref:uncharacterized protein LOC124439724 n=1 Tax=Xenia sp. Carnegie-2017 TaxID=2897299 RepID=UPI001F04AB14|nr:uncharacterized protein LOC124439724 [Xenia sp. Carnegie-2017]
MASPPKKLKIEANGSRLSKFLINKGTQALKTTLQFNINFRSSNLSDELNESSNKSTLESLRQRRVINKEQWNLLYPSTGLPNLDNFDISLLTVLLRNICGLTAPHGGWDNLPSSSDTSISANIARIKFYRNKVYGHISTTSVDDGTFERLWDEISKALVGLGIQQTEIVELKEAPLSPNEANYLEMLKEWYEKEQQLIDVAEKTNENVEELKKDFEAMKNKVEEIKESMPTKVDVVEIKQEMATKADVTRVKELIQDKICPDLKKLAKFKFNGLINDLNKKYLEGTRQWLFEKLDTWFNDKSEDASNVLILIAGPGVGKSVFAAEVCRQYSEKEKLAACHFCRYNRSDERNPRILIESLACSMCDTILDFKSKLNEELQRNHSKESIADAFRVLLNNPLHSLKDYEPMLLVIDALDESQVEGKSELLELITDEFGRLPKWIKIFITSRPELPVQTELKDMNPVEIETQPHDRKNEYDLCKYLEHELKSNLFIAERWHEDSDDSFDRDDSDYSDNDYTAFHLLVKKCEGSFLYAYHAQESLKKEKTKLTVENIKQLVPTGLSKFYAEQFKRLNKSLKEIILSTHKTVISDKNFTECLEVLVTYQSILPLSFLFQCLGFSDDMKFKDRIKIHEVLSQFFPIYDDYLTVYHKSLIDWLKSDGYEEHEFTVDPKNGHKFLWHACEKVFEQIKKMNIFKDQMNTAMIKYALENGIYHMLQCGENVDFSWIIDVKVFCVKLMVVKDKYMDTIWSELHEIITTLPNFLRKDVLKEQLFHLLMTVRYASKLDISLFYLQIIANAIDSKNERRLLARDLLKQGKFSWFEDLELTYLTNRYHLTVSLRANVTSLCVSSNEELLAVGYENGQISIFELPEFKQRCTLGTALDDLFVPRNICCCSFSPTGNRLVTSDRSTEVKLWDVNNGRLLLCLQSDGVVNRCSFSNSGLFIAAKYYEFFPKDVSTAWNSLTLQRIDRRCVVDHQKLQCTDKCSEFLGAEFVETLYVFEFPKAIDIIYQPLPSMITHHYRDCILSYTSHYLTFFEITQLRRSLGNHGEIEFCLPFVGCSCIYRYRNKVHPISFKEFYVVPYFSKLNIFKTDHLLKSSFISEELEIKCCCFSPDGSFFAAFAVGDHVNIYIWSIERCTIIQTVPMKLKNALGCWWSDGLLWIWDGSDHLMKISASSENFVDSTQAKHVNIGFKPNKILTFGDVLVCIDEQDFVQVVRIAKGEIQYNERFPLNGFQIKAAAVSPDNSIILTVNKTEYTLWKWGNNNNVLYLKPWHTAEIPITAVIEKFVPQQVTVNDLEFNCCISDSKQAVITFSARFECMGIYLINFHVNGDVNAILHDVSVHLLDSNPIVHKSYCIGVLEDRSLVAVDLRSCEECAKSVQIDYLMSNITMHSNTGTLAIVDSSNCRIQFLKLNVPE